MHSSLLNKKHSEKDLSMSKTKIAVLLHNLLSEPLMLFFGLVNFILCKSLHGTHFQVTVLTMLKPSMGLLILYWSSAIHFNSDKLKGNLVWSGILARAPFLFFPWIQNPWIFIVCAAVYIFFYRASNPAWMEVIKMNLPAKERGRVYSLASALGYAEGVIIGLCVIPWLRVDDSAWRYCFQIAGLIGMASVIVQSWAIPKGYRLIHKGQKIQFSLKEKLIKPWREAYSIMSSRPDFMRFQLGFFLCGFGLMMNMAIIPIYCANVLNISISEFAAARMICMCIGYVLFSKFWSKKLNSLPIFEFMVYVIIFFILHGIFLVLASFDTKFLYFSFFIYGIAQAGSHLSWNLSGPIFAKNQSSTVFSGINVLMVGIRGCIAPAIGSFIYVFSGGPYLVFTFFILLSFLAIWVMIRGLSSQTAT